MTPAQHSRFYFPAWNRAASALGWKMLAGRLQAQELTVWTANKTAEALYHQIWQNARLLASKQHRAATAEDLRHACHIVALGKNLSSKDLSNKQCDRVVILFRILANPDDIDTILDYIHPENADRRRYVYSIQQLASFKYIDAIASDKFSAVYTTPFWEDLPINALRQLHMTLLSRVKTSHPDENNNPF